MGSRRSGELFGHLETLFRVGTVGGLSDAQLLERFVAGRDEAGEVAFRRWWRGTGRWCCASAGASCTTRTMPRTPSR